MKNKKLRKFRKQYVGYADVKEYPQRWDRSNDSAEWIGAFVMPMVSMTKKPLEGTKKVRVTIEEI